MCIFLLSILCQFGNGQDVFVDQEISYQYNNILRLSPFELARGELQLGYERYFTNRTQSLVLNPSIFKYSRGEESRDGFQLMLQYRFYLSQLYHSTHETLYMYNIGFYAAPYLLGLSYSEGYETYVYDPVTYDQTYELVKEEINALEGGALLGIQLDITKRIVIDIFIGGGIRESSISSTSAEANNDFGILELGYTGVKPRVGFQMGITF